MKQECLHSRLHALGLTSSCWSLLVLCLLLCTAADISSWKSCSSSSSILLILSNLISSNFILVLIKLCKTNPDKIVRTVPIKLVGRTRQIYFVAYLSRILVNDLISSKMIIFSSPSLLFSSARCCHLVTRQYSGQMYRHHPPGPDCVYNCRVHHYLTATQQVWGRIKLIFPGWMAAGDGEGGGEQGEVLHSLVSDITDYILDYLSPFLQIFLQQLLQHSASNSPG